jgi:hypothetical protein
MIKKINLELKMTKSKFTMKFKTIILIFTSILILNAFLFLNIKSNIKIHQITIRDSQISIKSKDIDINIIWDNLWGGLENDHGWDVDTSSNSIYLVGETRSFGSEGADLFLTRYNTGGSQVWNTTWGGSLWDGGHAITINNSDPNNPDIYVTGYTQSYGYGNNDVLIIKYDDTGNKIWNKTWGGSDTEKAYDIINNGSHIFIVGDTKSYGAGNYDAFLLILSSNGTIIENYTWGGTNFDQAVGVTLVNNDIYFTGWTNNFGAEAYDVFVVKFNSSGVEDWYQIWGGTYEDKSVGIYGDSSGLYITGETRSFGSANFDLFITKYSLGGNSIWNFTWGGDKYEMASRIIKYNSHLYISGYTSSYGAGDYDALLMKLHENGTMIWYDTWGGSETEWGTGISILNSKIYISGYTESDPAVKIDAFIIKYGLELIPPHLEPIIPNIGTNPSTNLEWNKIYAATTYKIYRSDNFIDNLSESELVIETGLTYYEDLLDSYGTYYYVIVSSNGTHDSTISNCINVTFISISTPILTLNSLSFTIEPNISISWTSVSDVINYKIYRSTNSITNIAGLTPIATINNTSYNETLPTLGTYYYVVIATTEYGNSSLSNQIVINYLFTSEGLSFFLVYIGFILIFGIGVLIWFLYKRRKLDQMSLKTGIKSK